MRISRTIRSAASAVTSAEPTAVGITSTTSAPDEVEPGTKRARGPKEVTGRHAARLRRAGARGKGRVEHVDVDRQERRAGAHDLDGASDHLAYAQLAHVVHEEARDAVLGLPGELGFSGPVAAQADLDVAAGVEVALLHEPVEGRPV